MFDQGTLSEFEPSATTLQKMLYVRKKPLLLGGLTHPGLFGDHNFSVDVAYFFLVFFLELVGGYFIYQSVHKIPKVSLEAALGVALVLIFVDMLFAFGLHRFKYGHNTLLKVENICLSSEGSQSSNARAKHNANIIRRNSKIATICGVGLFLAAAIKLLIYWGTSTTTKSVMPGAMATAHNELGSLIGLTLVYFFVAYIHHQHTFYAVYGFLAKRSFVADMDKFVAGDTSGRTATEGRFQLANLNEYDRPDLLAIGNHRVVSEQNKETKNSVYRFVRRGLLRDAEIDQIYARAVSPEARQDLLMRMIEAQFAHAPNKWKGDAAK